MKPSPAKPKKCKECKTPFIPSRPLQAVCSPVCGLTHARAKREKEEAKERAVERKADREKKVALKSRAKWLSECQAIVNKYVRLKAFRAGEGCYTCGATPAQKFGGTYDAGHFRSVGSAPHLRYWIPQIKLQCIPCNRHKGGQALLFRRHLVQEHGSDWVEALEGRQEVAKFTVDYLQRLKAVMSKRVRRLEKRLSDSL